MSSPRCGPKGQAAGHSLAATTSEAQGALGDFARLPIASRRQAALLARMKAAPNGASDFMRPPAGASHDDLINALDERLAQSTALLKSLSACAFCDEAEGGLEMDLSPALMQASLWGIASMLEEAAALSAAASDKRHAVHVLPTGVAA